MIVDESSLLLMALDRRLQVDRLLGIDPARPVAQSTDSPSRGPAPSPFLSPSLANDTAASMRGAAATTAAAGETLSIGRIVTMQVVDVPSAERVVAKFGDMLIALSWPNGQAGMPRPGDAIALRVLALAPTLTLQSVPQDTGAAVSRSESAAPWSMDALRLQTIAGPLASSFRGSGPLRFDAPVLTPMRDEQAASPSLPTAREAEAARIAIEATATGSSRAPTPGIDAHPLVGNPLENSGTPAAFVPLVFHGPAWAGQPMELVIRRDRADDTLDNPALDHWCGEVVIDLPRLGRVAGHIAFSMQGLRVRLEADDDASASALSDAASELAAAFTALDLRVAGLSIGSPAPDAMIASAAALLRSNIMGNHG
jgi:hypothetical protein